MDLVGLERKWIKEYEPPFETDFGTKDYEEIEDDLFLGLGYKIGERTVVPKLSFLEPLQCHTLFASAAERARRPMSSSFPIPFKLKGQFLLNGYSQYMPISGFLIKEESDEKIWKADDIKERMGRSPEEIEEFGEDGKALYYAMSAHRVEGKKGMVLRTGSPWIEATAFGLGASCITTVGFSEIEIVDFPRITYKDPHQISREFADHAGAYDFFVSFGVVELAGFGRQGELLDPFGDLKEVQKAHCLLKRGGLLFLGIPIGWDILMWNYQRIYGRARLALLTAGFDMIDMFYKDTRSKLNIDWFVKPTKDQRVLKRILENDFHREVIWKRVVIILRKR